MSKVASRFRKHFNGWTLATSSLILLILVPLVYILAGIWNPGSDTWDHLATYLLPEYLSNTLLLMIITGGLTGVIGVSTAWIISTYDFPGRGWLSWALIMPLSIPTYISAFAYGGIFDYTGSLQTWLQKSGIGSVDIMHLPGIAVIISLVLYPYVYLISRASFMSHSERLWEVARSLGSSSLRAFWSVALPLARPAIAGGISLVLMEVLNDYGAMKYFGVPTLTTGIFRAWFALEDVDAAIRLSACLLLLVALLVAGERYLRRQAKFSSNKSESNQRQLIPLTGGKALGLTLICMIPVLGGFIFPVIQLLGWALKEYETLFTHDFWRLIKNSFLLAGLAALICVFAAILIGYTRRIIQTRSIQVFTRLAVLGYAVPGAVIAIGVMVPFIGLNKWMNAWIMALSDYSPGLFLSEGFVIILIAYLVRYLAVAFQPIESGLEKVSQRMDESARSLGYSPLKTLFKVHLPLVRNGVISAAILVFVDVLKELPLTLILRPFNFDSLATRTFELASDEMLAESAIPALLIVVVGAFPIIFLNRLMGNEH